MFWKPSNIGQTSQQSTTTLLLLAGFSAALFFCIILFFHVYYETDGQFGDGMQKCEWNNFVQVVGEKPGNSGHQAEVFIIQSKLNGNRYFYKAHLNDHVFRQERKILHELYSQFGPVTPQAHCYLTRPRKALIFKLADGRDLFSSHWYHPDNPTRIRNYEELVRAVAHLFASLAALHQLNYLHNDLRPNNVIFDGKRLQVIDFGLARKIGSWSDVSYCSYNSPPEVISLRDGDGKDKQRTRMFIDSTAIDWYTFGVLVHFFLKKGLHCIDEGTDVRQDSACAPGIQEMFWPYRSVNFTGGTVNFAWTIDDSSAIPFPPVLDNFLRLFITNDAKSRDFRGERLKKVMNHGFFKNINWQEINPSLFKLLGKQ